MITETPLIAAFLAAPDPVPPAFRPGDVVVVPAAHPLVCVVLDEPADGLLRLGSAACPEAQFAVSTAEVEHLSVWLLGRVAPAGA